MQLTTLKVSIFKYIKLVVEVEKELLILFPLNIIELMGLSTVRHVDDFTRILGKALR